MSYINVVANNLGKTIWNFGKNFPFQGARPLTEALNFTKTRLKFTVQRKLWCRRGVIRLVAANLLAMLRTLWCSNASLHMRRHSCIAFEPLPSAQLSWQEGIGKEGVSEYAPLENQRYHARGNHSWSVPPVVTQALYPPLSRCRVYCYTISLFVFQVWHPIALYPPYVPPSH